MSFALWVSGPILFACWLASVEADCVHFDLASLHKQLALLGSFSVVIFLIPGVTGGRRWQLANRTPLLMVCGLFVSFVFFFLFGGTAFWTAWFWTGLVIGSLSGRQWFLLVAAAAVGQIVVSSILVFLPFWQFYRCVRGVQAPLRKQIKGALFLSLLASLAVWVAGVAAAFCWHHLTRF